MFNFLGKKYAFRIPEVNICLGDKKMEIVIGLAVIGFAGWWFFLKDKKPATTTEAPYKVEAEPAPAPVVEAPVAETPAPKAGGKATGRAPAAAAKATKAPAKPKAEKKPAAPKAPKAPAKAPAKAKTGGKAAAPKNTVAK